VAARRGGRLPNAGPPGTRRWQHAIGTAVILVLAAAVALPAYKVTQLATVQRALIAGLFPDHQKSATVEDAPDLSAGKQRVNVLLGGDAGPAERACAPTR
jgi:hypothetical protein